jgi:hypothetical protein
MIFANESSTGLAGRTPAGNEKKYLGNPPFHPHEL